MARRSQKAQLTQAAKCIQKTTLWFLLKPANLNAYAIGIPKSAVNGELMLRARHGHLCALHPLVVRLPPSEVLATFVYIPSRSTPICVASGHRGQTQTDRLSRWARGLLFHVSRTSIPPYGPTATAQRRRTDGTPLRARRGAQSQQRPPSAPCDIQAAR